MTELEIGNLSKRYGFSTKNVESAKWEGEDLVILINNGPCTCPICFGCEDCKEVRVYSQTPDGKIIFINRDYKLSEEY